jgi:hypothetical protein
MFLMSNNMMRLQYRYARPGVLDYYRINLRNHIGAYTSCVLHAGGMRTQATH